jgi:L-gulonolactone oxidase
VRNWAGNEACLPLRVERPASTDEVAAIVADAHREQQRVKVIGAVGLVGARSGRSQRRIFASPRHVRFVEMEYGVPFADLAEAVDRVRQLTRTVSYPVLFPIEVRVSAADDIPLSTGFGREWVAPCTSTGAPYEAYFQGVETIMDEYAGRPHWGKLHFQTAATMRERYPEWEEFACQRARLDPAGTFRNDYLIRVLGAILT